MNDRFNTVILIILTVVIIFLGWKITSIKNDVKDANDALKKSIIASDSIVTKEADGRYSKLVNYYDTQKGLMSELKGSNEELYKIVKKQGERILSLTDAFITLRRQISEGSGSVDPIDSNRINLALRYPNDNNPFINWDGSVDKNTAYYKGMWTFGRLPLQIVLTEEQRGLWKSRLIGPDWLEVDSISINSLPAGGYIANKPKKLQFFFGGGYIKSLSTTGSDGFKVGGGVDLFDHHNLFFDVTTNKEYIISYYYKFK